MASTAARNLPVAHAEHLDGVSPLFAVKYWPAGQAEGPHWLLVVVLPGVATPAPAQAARVAQTLVSSAELNWQDVQAVHLDGVLLPASLPV